MSQHMPRTATRATRWRIGLTSLTCLALLAGGCSSGSDVVSGTESPSDSAGQTTDDGSGQDSSGAVSGESPTDGASDSAGQADSPGSSPAAVADCAAAGTIVQPDLDGVPETVAQTARELYASAAACDSAALIARAENDQTTVTFGSSGADVVLALPNASQEYLSLVEALSTTPGEGEGQWAWPRVATEAGAADDAAWDEAVAGGLISANDVPQMKDEGYLGYRVVIADDGRWLAFVAGD